MKKQTIVVIFIVVGLLIVGIIGGGTWYFISKKEKDNKLEVHQKIKSNYSDVVKVKKDTNIYQKIDNEMVSVGKIYKNMIMNLEDVEKTKLSSYYKIEGNDLFLYYNDVYPSTKVEVNEPYLPFSEMVLLKENGTILLNNEKAISFLKETSYDILKKNEDSYTVLLFDSLLEVPKDSVKELLSVDRKEKLVTDIPVFKFNSIEESCSSGSDCVTFQQLEKIFQWAKEKNIVSIKSNHLKEWIEKRILLPENALLFLYDKDHKANQIVELETKYQMFLSQNNDDLNFNVKNKRVNKDTAIDKIPFYSITVDTNMARVEEMFQGKEPVVEVIKDQSGIAVLNYHFFYDKDSGEQCNESICLDTKNFKEQLQYLKDQGYKTLKMQEFVDWKKGKIDLPKKSVLLTIDDGAMGTYNHLPRILEEYDMYATLFLISGWWPKDKYLSTHLEIQSHGHDLHHNDFCNVNNKCGVKTGLLTEAELLADLKLSTETIGTSLAFCYPFYSYNNSIMSTVKKAGFKVAFAGGNKKAKKSSLDYAIPRYVIYKNTSLEQFKGMITN